MLANIHVTCPLLFHRGFASSADLLGPAIYILSGRCFWPL